MTYEEDSVARCQEVRLLVEFLAENEYIKEGLEPDTIISLATEWMDGRVLMDDRKGVKGKASKKTPPASDRQGVYEEDNCQARIWAEGYDSVQCSFSKVDECFCKRHGCNEWWLGVITDERPKHPTLISKAHPDGLPHYWRKVGLNESSDEEEEPEIVEQPKPRRGRPKGSKNKKKQPNGDKEDITMDDIQALIDKKQKSLNE
jgi:hypothetical protein